MNKPILSVENLGKRYILAHKATTKRRTLTESLSNSLQSIPHTLRNLGQRDPAACEEFWALKDVNFNLEAGDRIGIIGRNGAGKSTLLKLLSRITEPSTGRITLRGRVASLLEVGTGFHPELTGRENIFLNGSILGMNRAEITRKFDEIVAFAEVQRFLDTPVKRYSSGMYVRLAFAVAAHLEPEILVVDEVLAVGDAQFQKKCLGRMEQVGDNGRTVIFVSHDMSAVSRLCTSGLFLQQGQAVFQGSAPEAIRYYQDSGAQQQAEWKMPEDASERSIQFQHIRLVDMAGKPVSITDYNRPCQLEITYKANSDPSPWVITGRLTDGSGNRLFSSWDTDSIPEKNTQVGGLYRTYWQLPHSLLRPGSYSISISACELSNSHQVRRTIHRLDDVIQFAVSDVGYLFNPNRRGLLTPSLQWQSRLLEPSLVE